MMQVPDDLRKVGLYRTIPSRVFGSGNIWCLQILNDEFWPLVSEKFCKRPETTQTVTITITITITKPTVSKPKTQNLTRGSRRERVFATGDV